MAVHKVVLPVAGLGTRFLPATKAQPKEMLALVDKPLVQYAVEEAAASGMDLAILVTGRGKNAIEDHFDVSKELEQELTSRRRGDLAAEIRALTDLLQITYVRQKQALGLGHAVLTARDLVGDEPFGVVLSDDVIDSSVPCLKQMIRAFDRYRASIVAIQHVPRSSVSNYGIIRGHLIDQEHWGERLYRIDDMVEKPKPEHAPSDLGIVGRYILTPAVFRELSQTEKGTGQEIQLTDALRRLLDKEPIYGFVFEGDRYDAGDKLGFVQATIALALKRPEMAPALRSYLKTIHSELEQRSRAQNTP